MENILELQQVSKTYPKSDFILDNVRGCFRICRGEWSGQDNYD